MRKQMLQTESGKAALMEGRPPNMEQIDSHIFMGLQVCTGTARSRILASCAPQPLLQMAPV